ncbi:hypothetical protein [Motiliproteus sp. SC1-56]|uniref:hypothetical protein n=1 Tax=Motiliproteus sp. SC1-56 TaxID=2799565 RepID=UPI001A9006AC|nr:hypothetical protein [Motiliproteus sp. SC1-56]
MIYRPLLLAVLLIPMLVRADELPVAAFFGDYIGHLTMEDGIERDLSVSIAPADGDDRFSVKWTTVTHKADGRLKRAVYRIKFVPTDREHIYASAMKTNVFGRQVPLDPMQGDPFVWARIKGATLTVHALLITDDGGYEMQTYHRTLNDKGLVLEFIRKDSHEDIRHLQAQLTRIAG